MTGGCLSSSSSRNVRVRRHAIHAFVFARERRYERRRSDRHDVLEVRAAPLAGCDGQVRTFTRSSQPAPRPRRWLGLAAIAHGYLTVLWPIATALMAVWISPLLRLARPRRPARRFSHVLCHRPRPVQQAVNATLDQRGGKSAANSGGTAHCEPDRPLNSAASSIGRLDSDAFTLAQRRPARLAGAEQTCRRQNGNRAACPTSRNGRTGKDRQRRHHGIALYPSRSAPAAPPLPRNAATPR